MENFSHVPSLIGRDYYLASVDLQNAYYSVPVQTDYCKYLRFYWNGVLFQYTSLLNGLSSAPRVFNKIMKPLFSKLRSEGPLSVFFFFFFLI